MRRLPRAYPVRVLLALLAVVFVEVNAIIGLGVSDSVQLAVIGLIGAAIGADTVRPSGMAREVKRDE